MKNQIEVRIKHIEKEVTEDYQKELMETLRELGQSEHSVNGDKRKQIWKLLKKNYPKILTAVPVGKKDGKGNIIKNHEGLKKLYLQTYVNRLRNRPIKPDLEEIMKLKTELFELRLQLSKKGGKLNHGQYNKWRKLCP